MSAAATESTNITCVCMPCSIPLVKQDKLLSGAAQRAVIERRHGEVMDNASHLPLTNYQDVCLPIPALSH